MTMHSKVYGNPIFIWNKGVKPFLTEDFVMAMAKYFLAPLIEKGSYSLFINGQNDYASNIKI